MKKTFFIVPGFYGEPTDNNFKWLSRFLKQKGFDVKIVPIKWRYLTMLEYSKQFVNYYKKHTSGKNYVLGFSYGAVIAFLTANELRPRKIFLCSLSPDFKEDLRAMKPWMRKYVGKKRIENIKTRSGVKIAKSLNIPSVIFYGEIEARQFPQLKIRCEQTGKLAAKSKVVVVKDAPHKIDHINYIASIQNELKSIT